MAVHCVEHTDKVIEVDMVLDRVGGQHPLYFVVHLGKSLVIKSICHPFPPPPNTALR